MFKSLFGGNDADEEPQADERLDGEQQAGDPAAGQPGQPADTMAGNGDGVLADEGPDVGELDVRMGELQDDVDSVESSLRALESSQEEFADTIEEMDERVRQLVGIYDRLSAAENPFVDADDTAGAGHTDGAGSVDNGESADSSEDRTVTAGTAPNGHENESVVSFDDLEQRGGSKNGAGHAADGVADDELSGEGEDGGTDTDRDQDREPGEQPEPEPERAPAAESERTPPAGPERPAAGGPGREPVLESVPDSYAGEVLVMEWLSVLMDGSGPADALRAVGHYEDAGWISQEVRDHLVDVIGGPTLDVHVDPTQSRESTADEHAVSYRYLSVLAQLDGV